jgi:hypothetical protein
VKHPGYTVRKERRLVEIEKKPSEISVQQAPDDGFSLL